MSTPTEQTRLIKGLRVIVVDDISDSKDLLEMYLSQKKARVKAVDSAKDALTAIKNFRPNLIISDIYMPEQDGYWLIEQLNSLNTNSENYIPAIAVTAAAREQDREQLIAAGYDGYLAKPFLFEDLTTLIAKVITKKN